MTLDDIIAAAQRGDADRAVKLVQDLRQALMPTKGTRARTKGGVEYKGSYMLSAVMFADNLRALPKDDGDFLATVALQRLIVKTLTLTLMMSNSNSLLLLFSPNSHIIAQNPLPRALDVVAHPELAQHFKHYGFKFPSRSSLYTYRLYVDYCTMLWARDYVFSESLPDPWWTHFRLDSSPQYGRNYLVGELDHLQLDKVDPSNLDALPLAITT